MDSRAERTINEATARAVINHKLTVSGEKDRLKEMLDKRLTECGWKDQLRKYTKDFIQQRGMTNLTVDDLIAEITPRGRATVPDSVKHELLTKIREFLEQHADDLEDIANGEKPTHSEDN